MMLSKFESLEMEDSDDSRNGQLLHDIEEISKALYAESKTQKSCMISSSSLMPRSVKKSHFGGLKSKSKSKPGFDGGDEWLGEEHKASSIWGWRPFKALSHMRHRKFSCLFFCHVHCVENLPLNFNEISMSVHWKRKDSVMKTRTSRVVDGMVEFEETLMSKCTVYAAKNGSGNFVKYEPKHFLLYVSVVGAEGIDVGKHWVDLTRLLPLTLEELEKDKCSGKWSTSFKLAGKAEGATLHVSFGFLVTRDGFAELGGNLKVPLVLNLEENGLSRMSFVADHGSEKGNAMLRRVGSVPSSLTNASTNSINCLDVKFGWPKDVPDFSCSVDMLYGKLEEGSVDTPAKFDLDVEHLESLKLVPNSLSEEFNRGRSDDDEFTVIVKGVEFEWSREEATTLDESATRDLDVTTVEVIDVADIFKGEGITTDDEIKSIREDNVSGSFVDELLIDKHSIRDIEEPKPEEKVLDSAKVFISESAELEPSMVLMSDELEAKHVGRKLVKSLSLDDVAKAVAEDFFNLLQEYHTPSTQSPCSNLGSPRERLLRQFEEDMMISSSFLLGVDVQEDECESDCCTAPSISSSDYNVESVDFSPVIDMAQNQSVNQSSRRKMQAKSLERLETQSLMQRWGLNEDAFLSSPYYSTGGFGSPIFVSPEEPVALPPLGEGLEPLLQLKDGGLLRSMSPLLFRNAKNCGSLIMQASELVVLPAELGSDVMDILQDMASIGSERLSKKLHALMPLEELSGKIIQQLAWESLFEAEATIRPSSTQNEADLKIDFNGFLHVPGYNYFNSNPTFSDIGLEFIAAEDLPSFALDILEVLTIEGLRIQSGMSDQDSPHSIRVKSATDATSEHKIDNIGKCSDLLGVRGSADHVDGLLDLSISLDEWLRLDAWMFDNKNEVSEHTIKVLRAHHAKPSCLSDSNSAEEENTDNESGKSGFLVDQLTVALMTQLRDPLRNYEPVGAPLLGLIQVERVFTTMSKNSEESASVPEKHIDGNVEDKIYGLTRVPMFRLKEVHVAGLSLESDNSEHWASRRQQQSGSRWLLASGLTKKRDSHFSKSRSLVRFPTKVLRKPRTGSIIWSISRPVRGVEADPEFSTGDPLSRNPDIIFK